MAKFKGDGPVQSALCGWGTCTDVTDGHGICERHLLKAWAIVEVRRREEAAHAAGTEVDLESAEVA